MSNASIDAPSATPFPATAATPLGTPSSSEGWCPRFHSSLVSARDLLTRATKLAGAAGRTTAPKIDDAADHAREARVLLGDIVHEYDDIPEPLLDAISGAMRNADDAVSHIEDHRGMVPSSEVLQDVRAHLQDAVALLQQALAAPPR